jgi:dTDP-4-amino-4,6-dideoxygalactose transaminase
MRVPLLDLSEQYRSLAVPIRERLEEIFATQRFVLGPNVERFEKAIGQFIGTRHAIGISSGTDALLVAYMAVGLGPNDAIITTPYSFFATAGCVARTGALPLFVDIDRDTYNLSPQLLTEFLEKECDTRDETTVHRRTGKTVRAIVPVHLFGLCCDMKPITAAATQYRLPLIEDAAQAIGAEYPFGSETKQAGTMSDYACFSFYPSKNLGAAGDAGLVITNDDARAQLVKSLRQHGMEPRYYHHLIGGNFRLDEIQAAILDVKLPFLSGWSAARRTAADFYTSELRKAGLAENVTPPAEPYRDKVKSHHIYHQYVIRTKQRDALAKHLVKREIGTAIYYPVGLHLQTALAYLGHKRGDFPETEAAADQTLALPVFPEISQEAQSYVVDSIANFFH